MALDQATFLANLYQQEVNRLKMNNLAAQRKAEEDQLVIDYKVNECNAARAAIQAKYAALAQPLFDENNAIIASNVQAVING